MTSVMGVRRCEPMSALPGVFLNTAWTLTLNLVMLVLVVLAPLLMLVLLLLLLPDIDLPFDDAAAAGLG